MIKNIVFDLGNVLISFRPSEFFDKKGYPENIKAVILSDIFASKEWQLLDKGEINTKEAIASIARRSSLKTQEIAHIFNLRTELIFPLDQNVRTLPVFKKRGFRLYFLSNFPIDIFEEIKTDYYFFRYFDGGIISAEVKVSKPDIRIYKILMEKYSLTPDETLFIDDLETNVRGAEAAGMKGLLFTGETTLPEAIEKALH